MLLTSAHQTGLLTELQTTLSPSLLEASPSLRLAHSQPATIRRQLLTLLFLEAVGLRRIWDLRGYTGQALALLTGLHRAYGYRHTERFLAELARSGADAPLTEALASFTATLWKPEPQGRENLAPFFYVDGHRKPVYANSTWVDRAHRKSLGVSRSGGLARPGGPPVVGYHPSGRPASDAGAASHAYTL